MDLQIASRPELALLAGFCVSLFVYVAYRSWAKRKLARAQPHLASPAAINEKGRLAAAKDREPGEWAPVKFDYLRFEPSKEHFSTTKPIPYRPFKWGEYFVTMGIRNMPWEEWIVFDNEYEQTRKVCDYRIRTRGDKLLKVHPGRPGIVPSGHAAAVELVHELAEYLSRRYPDVFRVTRRAVSKRDEDNGWYGEGKVKSITIVPFKETYDLETDEPLKVARMLIQEDFTLMVEGTDGQYYLQAGAICIPGSWRLEDKIGMPLEDIHVSGDVPQYKSKLQFSMDRFFRRMPVDKAVLRNNYSFQLVPEREARNPAPAPGSLLDVDPDELSWSVTMNGDEDVPEYERGKSAAEAERHPVAATASTLVMRTERQTLRRLPRTGAVLFTIRTYQTRVEDLVKEPGVPGRLASAIRSWPEDVAVYKCRRAFQEILPYLDECHAEQIAKGIVSEETLDKSKFPL